MSSFTICVGAITSFTPSNMGWRKISFSRRARAMELSVQRKLIPSLLKTILTCGTPYVW